MILQGKGLIVPDVHEKIAKLKRILTTYENDVGWVVFLSDFMDNYDGLTEATHETCVWLAANAANPKYYFVWANHDIQYAFQWGELRCSGFTPTKYKLVQGYLNQEHWKHFRCFFWVGGGSASILPPSVRSIPLFFTRSPFRTSTG